MGVPLSRESLVERLVAARHEQHLSIRRAASAAKVPASTAQGWFEGKHLPTPALMPNFLNLLEELGLVSSGEERDEWQRAINFMRTNVIVEESPYVGLRSYRPSESSLYFGRERAYDSLVEACTQPDARTVVVVGDSGSGKSSLLAAGLIGRAAAEGGPLEHLEPVSVAVADLATMPAPEAPTLLVVDQFEEAEQLDAKGQAAVFDALADLPAQVELCVVAVTAGSFGFAMRDERFAAHLASPVLVGPLTSEEYTQIIEEPARQHGRRVAPELVELALRDLRLFGDPSPGTALPLLSSAMRRCWRAADGTTITAADYLGTGGLWSALDEEAETVFLVLGGEDRAVAKRLILSMVQVEGDNILRRRISRDALAPEMRETLDGFVNTRLMTVADGQIEISHDALLSRWRRLVQWVEEERASLLIARRITMAAQLWDEGGRHDEALMPVEAELWNTWTQAEDSPLLTAEEHDFIDASLQLAQHQQDEQRRHVGRLRRRQHVAMVAAALALVMMTVAVAAGYRSETYRHEAEAATLTAQGRQVALIADEVRPVNPNTAGQLSVAANAIDDSVQTRSAVLKSAGSPMPTRAVGPTGNTMVAHLPDHGLIVRGDSTGTISVWRDADLTAPPTAVDSGGGQLFALAATTLDGRALALVGGQQTAGVWDLTDSPRLLADFGTDTVTYAADWDGPVLIFGTLEGEARRVDFSDVDQPEELAPLELGEDVQVTAVAASDERILVAGRQDRVEVFTRDGERVQVLPTDGRALALDVSPDGSGYLVGQSSGTATIWGPAGDELAVVHEVGHGALVHAALHLGDRVILAGAFGAIHEYTPDLELVATYPERTVVVSLDAVDDHLLVGATGGTTMLWDPAQHTTVLTFPDGVRTFGVTPGDDVVLIGTSGGARVVASSPDGWDELPLEAAPGEAAYTFYYAMSGDGEVVVNQTTDADLVTFQRDGGRYVSVDVLSDQDSLQDLRLSRTGRYMAVGYQGREGYHLYERDGSGWRSLGVIESWPAASTFSRDERLFAAMHIDGDGTVVHDLTGATPTKLADVYTEDRITPETIAFSPENDLAVGDNRGEVSVFSLADPDEPELVHHLRDARSSLSQLGYSVDGHRLFASSREGQLWVWRVDGGDIGLDVQLTPGVDAAVTGAAWFDGHYVMSVSDGRTVAWPDDPVAAAADLCGRFGDPLTDDEWSRLVPGTERADGC